ncbi:MAG: PIN domain-containing protein [Deltaproteobacteria bacterium]|nr:PIN domain-containing protein [Deltaproteobacteria bacterium]
MKSHEGKEWVGIDTNVLVFADDVTSPHNDVAKKYLEDAFRGSIHVCLSHQVLMEYFSVITSPHRVKHPLSIPEAKDRLLFLNRTRRIKKIYPSRTSLKRCIELCAQNSIKGVKIFDVYYATVLLDNKIYKLITQNEKDFNFITGLRTVNPFTPC